ncbi:MAG TPA: hypothetical protein V6C63_05080 [Allocoleopsis sp.]
MALIQGVQFPNALTLEQYYLSQGHLFGSCIRVAVAANGGLVGVFHNPSDSNTILVPFRIVGSSSVDGERMRYRAGSTIAKSSVKIPSTLAPATAINRAGLSNAAKGKLYPNGSGLAATDGAFEKTIFLSAHGADPTYENGSMDLRPGDSLYWMFVPDAALSRTISLEIIWGERSL